MTTPGQELSSIDFESMIGGPLIAMVNAQAQSAMTTVEFIKAVGFEHDDDGSMESLEYVRFKYPKEKFSEDGASTFEQQELEVPILTMLPIPYLRIEEVKIDFNAKINSIESRGSISSSKISAGYEAGVQGAYSGIGGGVKMKVSASHRKTTTKNAEVKRTYNLGVNVRAVQDEIPAGMERVLGILEGAIRSKPVEPTSSTTP